MQDGLAGVLEQIAAIALERPLVHPHQRGRMFLATVAAVCVNDQIAAADVEFAIQDQRDRKRRNSLGKVAIVGDDARNLALLPEGSTVSLSPGRTVPEAIWPANPRKV
jgi:hypothetical protein